MARRVIYCVHRALEWLDAADRLHKELGWKPIYWITRPENEEAVGRRFADAIRHRRFDANRGIAAGGLEHFLGRSLSLDQLTAALPYEPVAMDILNRVDLGRRFSYQERQRLYYRLLAYWLTVVKAHRAEGVVFSAPPHSIGEYLLYAAARVENLAIRIFRLTAVDGLHFICDRVEELPEHLLEAYRSRLSRGDSAVPHELAEEIARLRGASADYKPGYAADTDAQEARYAKLKARLNELHGKGKLENVELQIGKPMMMTAFAGLLQRTVFRLRRRERDDEPLERHWKVPGRPMDGPMLTRWEHRTYRDWAMHVKLKLAARYLALCRELPAGRPYVYFAMHYQPERTTSPDGGRFSDQYAVAALLSEALPEGWLLAIKEHPSQFKYVRTGEMARYPEYYDDLTALPNVVLLPPELPTNPLTDGARAVATVTGVVGWEALVRGKPVLCLGSAWYGACRGAFMVRSVSEARSAFEKIAGDIAPTEEATRMYVGAIHDVGRRVYHDPARAVKLKGSLSDALVELLASFEAGRDERLREQAG